MILRYLKFFLLALVAGLFASCSDNDDEGEFLFDREVTELKVIRGCDADADSGDFCYKVRFRYPMDTEKLTKIYVWVDSLVVGDTAKAVSKNKLEKADKVIEYVSGNSSLYGTIDVSEFITKDLVQERKSLMVAVYCDYKDDERPGSVQRVYVHFGDDMKPSLVEFRDSSWVSGSMIEWYRPTDQTDYYAPTELSGPIIGYHLVIYSFDEDEDLSKLKITVSTGDEVDSTGSTLYERDVNFGTARDSVWIQETLKYKNYLNIVVHDGKGYDAEDYDANRFRMVIEGFRSRTPYTIGLSAWDYSGNSSGSDGTSSVLDNTKIRTTDSIAPLIGTKIFTYKDSLYPELARLDSNNRLRIFWTRSVDPLIQKHGIKVDSVLSIPKDCFVDSCYNDVIAEYILEYYNGIDKKWVKVSDDDRRFARYDKDYYELEKGKFVSTEFGSLVNDTIRFVAPGDTLILRIRAVDTTRYYSKALVDTIVVAPSPLNEIVKCPEGFVPVSVGDSTVFCMERYEHRDSSGRFVSNVLHSEAVAACEAVSASGFTVSLCKERDWELVCLSGGSLTYGVIEEMEDAASYLFMSCNVATNDSSAAFDLSMRGPHCLNPAGVHDMPGQLQEWVLGRSGDTSAVVKGGSYKKFSGLDIESQARCTSRSFPYFTRPSYTTDTVYLYREGTKVDTVFAADTNRTLYGIITADNKDEKFRFKDTLQFFNVQNGNGETIGVDYAPYAEYKKGGDEWLETLANGLTYVPDHIEVVFVKKEKVAYREAAAFYKSNAIGFRCCAYPE